MAAKMLESSAISSRRSKEWNENTMQTVLEEKGVLEARARVYDDVNATLSNAMHRRSPQTTAMMANLPQRYLRIPTYSRVM